MLHAVAVGLGGFLGAVLRYGLSEWAHRLHPGPFPVGTFLVNAAGCLLLGGLKSWAAGRPHLSPLAQLFMTTGLLGALTTFSTFGFETLELLRLGNTRLAAANVAANLLVGMSALVAGSRLARLAL